jgi:hypothetical protein
MARIGLYPALIIVVFGIVVPFFIFKLGRLVGFAPLLGVAGVLGFGYGVVKSGYPWGDQGTFSGAAFIAASVLALVAYSVLSYWVGNLIDRTVASLRGK